MTSPLAGRGPRYPSKGTGGLWGARIYGNIRRLPARTCQPPLAVMLRVMLRVVLEKAEKLW